MTTHPPGHPTGPTGPGRDPGLLPTIGMVVRDAERLGAQLLAILRRPVDPASLPTDPDRLAQISVFRQVAGYHVDQALEFIGDLADVPLPPVGSAVKLPAVAPVAAGESPGGPPAPGATCTQGTPRGPYDLPARHAPGLGHRARP